MTTLWKSLPRDMKPHGFQYSLKKWHKQKGEIQICQNGLHASINIIDAMLHVSAEVIAKVEVRGQSDKRDDKQAWQEMRIIEAYEWTKEDSIALSIYASRQVIGIYEKEYPQDKRPRKAIEATEEYAKNPTEENMEKCRTAAEAAASAASAAWAASAAASAAWAAASAAREAASAAWSAADQAMKSKCHRFVLRRLSNKKPLNKLLINPPTK